MTANILFDVNTRNSMLGRNLGDDKDVLQSSSLDAAVDRRLRLTGPPPSFPNVCFAQSDISNRGNL